ncbi:pyridoxal-dependent decarboxylase [Oscillatoria sp. FACHB-1406]|uniref:pyridoxal-dependent decarboxylase n=1 Tax=Oscillatoria sp. FACHB-1406 TaxID=2692846 RepID=UPI001685C30A|nr:pyridoxal-dependent decarboxylase [Oscillatoria sp. FACHB-1406]MBD2578443.1 histidine decarboxylase [Oscillatoria sp. FACHB-1406]
MENVSGQGALPTKPTQEPCSVYPLVPGIDCQQFQLPAEGLSSEQRQKALEQFYQYLSTQRSHFLGYQLNQQLDYEEDISNYLNFQINNIGDPFESGFLTTNTKVMERAVLDYYASLWNARWPHNRQELESYWGYLLTMGSSEGNLYGLWNARDYLAGKMLLEEPGCEEKAKQASLNGNSRSVQRRLIFQQASVPEKNPNAYAPVAFYSEDTHYSIVKGIRVLNISTFNEIGSGKIDCPLKFPADYPDGFSEQYIDENGWPLEVPSNTEGQIYIPALVKLVECFASQGYPILVNFNYGTTFKGAYDDVEAAGLALMPIFKKYGLDERKIEYSPERYDTRNGFWFHVDAALGGTYMPFIEMACNDKKIDRRGPNFDFRLPFVHSIVASGHQWNGAPWPCGIYMTKVKFQLNPPDKAEYLGSLDTTFAGSRNGFSAMILWDYLAKNSHSAQIEKALRAQKMAEYACDRLQNLERQLTKDLWVDRTSLALAVRFKRPNDRIVFKYSLSCATLYVNGEKRMYAHIFTMPHVTEKLIEELIEDLSQPGAFYEPEEVCQADTESVISEMNA